MSRLIMLVFLSFFAGVARSQPGASSYLATANNHFAVDMYKQLMSSGKAVFFSPYSIYSAVQMTGEGARGKTALEIQKVFYSMSNTDAIRKDLQQSQVKFNSLKKSGDSIRVSNALWIHKSFVLESTFESLVKDVYKAGIKQVDFASQPDKSRMAINDWTAGETNNRIKNLLAPGTIDASTKLVLVNTIWFKGKWMTPFKKEATYPEEFKTGKEKISTAFMHQQTYTNYYEGKGVQAIELPYESNGVSMIIVLPNEGNESSIDSKLTPELMNEWTSNMKGEETSISLPKFKMECDFDLSGQLIKLGMSSAFTANANFTGISKNALQISQVIHKSFVEVDEAGTEAAAATAVVMRVTSAMPSPPKKVKQFKADRPFLFLLCDKQTKTILFMGKMTKP